MVNEKYIGNGVKLEGQVHGSLTVTRRHERYTPTNKLVYAKCTCGNENYYSMYALYRKTVTNCGCIPKDLRWHNKKWTPSELQSVKDAIMSKPEQSVISVCREIAPQYGVSAEKVYATYNRMSKKGWKL